MVHVGVNVVRNHGRVHQRFDLLREFLFLLIPGELRVERTIHHTRDDRLQHLPCLVPRRGDVHVDETGELLSPVRQSPLLFEQRETFEDLVRIASDARAVSGRSPLEEREAIENPKLVEESLPYELCGPGRGDDCRMLEAETDLLEKRKQFAQLCRRLASRCRELLDELEHRREQMHIPLVLEVLEVCDDDRRLLVEDADVVADGVVSRTVGGDDRSVVGPQIGVACTDAGELVPGNVDKDGDRRARMPDRILELGRWRQLRVPPCREARGAARSDGRGAIPMFCSACGTGLADDSRFCSACGARLLRGEEAPDRVRHAEHRAPRP